MTKTKTTTKAPKPAAPKSREHKAVGGPEPVKPATPAPQPARAKVPAKPKRLSGLDAAAQLLAGSKEPLRCAELAERVLAKGLWKTTGKTPAATLNAAMLREIRDKGKESRFRKAGRGLFAAHAR
jgi:hypothetical protein